MKYIQYARHIVFILLILILSVFEWIQLDYSCNEVTFIENGKISYKILSISILFFITLLILIFVQKWWIAFLTSSMMSAFILICNYYVIEFHGMPLTINELRSARTAMGVFAAYRLDFSRSVKVSVVIFAFNLLLVYFMKKIENECITARKRTYLGRMILIVILSVYMYIGIFNAHSIKPYGITSMWIWNEEYPIYGYVLSVVDDWQVLRKPIKKVDNYQVSDLSQYLESESQEEIHAKHADTPDIIVILNETFYDLNEYTDVKTDKPYLDTYSSMTNAIKGYAVVPDEGGGTNNSEYELLTSNSTYLLNSGAPFNYLDMTGQNSIVNYLQRFSYTSIAMHPDIATGYSRNKAYPALGFDQSLFDTDFKYTEGYGNRNLTTDAGNYQDMYERYEALSDDNPRFI